jgi:hypothetical protein
LTRDKKAQEDFLGLCYSGSNLSEAECNDFINNELIITENQISFFKKQSSRKHHKFYELKLPSSHKFKMIKKDNNYTLNFYFNNKADSSLLKDLKLGVSKNWRFSSSNLNFKLNLILTDKVSSPFIQTQNGINPHVNMDRTTISWEEATDSDNNISRKILSHEFGHILGFNDCYIEYWDQTKRELIYYTLDSGNIMCSSNGYVQKQHIEKIIQAYNN